jgi:hypothetical protein
MKRDPITKYWDQVEPADPGPMHAWLYSADPGPPIDGFRDAPKNVIRLSRWVLARTETAVLKDREFVRAACGRRVRVIYLHPFDTAMVGVCPQCVSMAQLWQNDRDEYDRQVRLRNGRWAQRDAQRYEEYDEFDDDELARQEPRGTDPIDEEDVMP